MLSKPKVLGVIPGRGGSKRLPRKNCKKVGGHPMIAHTIMAASMAENLTDWLVSSDDQEILSIARKYEAPVPFERPPELATDEIRNIDVVLHALDFMEKQKGFLYDMVVLLQPTSPIRSAGHIDQAIDLLWNSECDSLASVKGPYQKRDPILKKINSKGLMENYRDPLNGDLREPLYIYNAAIYATKRNYFVENKKFISNIQVPLYMDDYYSADVDEESDLLVVEAFFSHLKSKGKI